MFKKKETQGKVIKDGKLVENDIGFIQETLELCKNLISLEAHSFASYGSTQDEYFLKVGKIFREKRTKYLKLITSKTRGGQSWCMSKHLCEVMMRMQELCTRCMNEDDMDAAKDIVNDAFEMFSIFLELNKFSDENVSLGKSEA